MSTEIWQYAKKLDAAGNPDAEEVRSLVQQFESSADFQDIVSRVNSLHELQQQQSDEESKDKKRKQ